MRFMSGICTGICSTIPPIFLHEIAPKEAIGFLGIFIQLMIAFGILVSFLLAQIFEVFLDGYMMWKMLLIVPVVPLVVQSYFFMCYFTFDTPKWLLFMSRGSEMEMVLRKIYKPWAWQSRMSFLDEDKVSIKSIHENLPGLLARSWSKPMALVYILCFIQQFSGINLSIFYSSSTVENFSLNERASLLTTIIGTVNFVSIFPTLFFINNLGRKTLLLQGLLGMGSCYTVFVLIGYFYKYEFSGWIQFSMLILSVTFYETSLGSVLWVYITEVLAVGWIGSAVCLHWLFASIIAGTYPFLLESYQYMSIQILYSICAFILFCGYFLVKYLAIDTKGIPIETITKQFIGEKDFILDSTQPVSKLLS